MYAGQNASVGEPQWFLAGATTTCVLRIEAIPGRVVHDFDGIQQLPAFDAMHKSGFNAVRTQTWLSTKTDVETCTTFDNSGDVLQREMDFCLDFGGVDVQVQAAQQAKARNMKIIHNVNLGALIPDAWLGFSYAQMLEAIDGEMHRQLKPFLEAGVQPDIILLENEGSAGVLYDIKLPSGARYSRGTGNNSQVPLSQLQAELSGHLPTGHTFAYPQLAGYIKQQVLSLRSAIRHAGMDDSTTRFGLHSHVQYVDWKNGIVYKPDTDNELKLGVQGTTYNYAGVIPSYILDLRAADMLDIMGFSSYPEPMAPASFSFDSLQATFGRLRKTLDLMDEVAKLYGKHTSGPWAGQYKKQALAVEYASEFAHPEQAAAQQQHTHMCLQILKSYPWMLGALWYEPTYCCSNWAGGKGSLYHKWSSADLTHQAPTPTMTTWGSYAHSPPASQTPIVSHSSMKALTNVLHKVSLQR